MSGTYILEVQTVTAKSGAWQTQLGATDNPSLVLAIYDPGHPATRYVTHNAAGNASLQFSVAYFLDGAGSPTPLASLPSGFVPTSCQATVTTGNFDPNDTGTVSFSPSQLSAPFSNFAAHTFNYPAALVAADILNGGLGIQFTNSGGSGQPTWYLLSASGAYTKAGITVTAVTPPQGPTTGGTPVTVTGTGFGGGGALSVTFGGNAATSVVYVNDTTLTCVTPAHALVGPVDVTVTLTGGDTPVSGTEGGGYLYASYMKGPDLPDVLPDTKFPPDFVFYTFGTTLPSPNWVITTLPADKGWFWSDASDPNVPAFTDPGKAYLTVT